MYTHHVTVMAPLGSEGTAYACAEEPPTLVLKLHNGSVTPLPVMHSLSDVQNPEHYRVAFEDDDGHVGVITRNGDRVLVDGRQYVPSTSLWQSSSPTPNL